MAAENGKSNRKIGHSIIPKLASTPVLDPNRLDEAAREAAAQLLREGESANTRRSYESALRYWAAWYMARYGQTIKLPMPPVVMVQFMLDHLGRTHRGKIVCELPAALDEVLVSTGLKGKLGPLALNTVEHRLTVLSKVHQLKRVPNPYDDPAVKQLLKRARRAYAKRGALPHSKTAATKEPLEAMLATCGDDLEGIRDRALLLFAWASGGRRRSEVAAAKIERLQRTKGGYTYRLGHSKTNQSGKPNPKLHPDKPILGEPADALEKWLKRSGFKKGAIFRRLWGETIGAALSGAAVGEIIKRRALAAGLAGDWAGHSIRSGFVTEAGKQRIPLGDVMAMTDHTNVGSVAGYYQAGAAETNPAATLLSKNTKPSN
jgi:integrase